MTNFIDNHDHQKIRIEDKDKIIDFKLYHAPTLTTIGNLLDITKSGDSGENVDSFNNTSGTPVPDGLSGSAVRPIKLH